ncbi:NUDIX domain-containing protein, partial [Halomonas sp.]|uniref:NUDIX domain-containing protein n=1 Tax=Halomonas sp. TaxID=1486246 RepID=UPI003563B414
MVDSPRGKEQAPGVSASFTTADVELVERRCLHQGFFRLDELHLRHRLFEGSWSGEVVREVHCRHDAVGVLLYDVERDAVVLIEQFRAGALDDPVSPWKLEVVAGLVKEGESPAGVARREAMEEAGCE